MRNAMLLTGLALSLVGLLGGCDGGGADAPQSDATPTTPEVAAPAAPAPQAQPGASQPPTRPMPAPGSPNVLLISIDTLRADHLGCYGHPAQATPNIDALSAAGLRFETCIASSPITLPSHATMLTGSYPFVHGARSNVRFRVSPENQTLPELLRARGYLTWAEVSAAVLNRDAGLAQGFDRYQGPGGMPGMSLERRADEITDAALRYLGQNPGRPFFGFVHYFDPHAPYAPPAPYDTKYADPYVGEIAYTDSQVGRLLQGLANSPHADNTIVVLTADHGEGRGQHGEASHSFYLYDTTQRVPLIIWYPKQLTPGTATTPARLVDLAPTLVGLLSLPRTEQMQGRDLLDPSDQRVAAYAETLEPQLAFEFSDLRALWLDGWKYIHAPQPLLFDLSADPGEMNNRASDEPQRLAAMQQHLRQVLETAPVRVQPATAARQVDQQDLADLAALGYIGGDDEELEAAELDRFERQGRDPHTEQETLQRFALAVGQLMSKDYENAVPTIKALLEREPESTMLLRYYAESLDGAGQADEALATYQRLLELRPGTTTARLQMARLQRRMGQEQAAAETLVKLIELAPQQVAAYIDLHQLLGRLGQFEQAEAVLNQGRQAVPGDYQLDLAWARQLLSKRQGSQAMQMIQDLMRRQPARFDAYGLLSDLQAQQGDAESSLKTLMDYHRRYPGVRRVIDPLALALARAGRSEEAIQLWEAAWAELPETGRRNLQLGVALRRVGRASDALARFEKATTLEPKLPAAWLGMAQTRQQNGDVPGALQAYQGLMRVATRNPQGYLGTASLQQLLGDAAAAAKTLEAGVKAIPRSPRLLESLCWLRATCSDDAVRDCSSAVELGTRLGELAAPSLSITDTRAAALACGGDYSGAMALLDGALQGDLAEVPEPFLGQVRARRAQYAAGEPFVENLPP